jgi:SAM-dependent methyltransferase/DNA-binding MarR family transcriptional regulator
MNLNEISLYWDKFADSLTKKRTSILVSPECMKWEQTLAILLPKRSPLRILDVGCGSGFLSILLTQMGHQVVGIDLSPQMIQCAYETASTFRRRIEFRIMNLEHMDFADNSFDVVVCCEVLSHLKNHSQAFSEIKRVLKKDGHFILFDTGELRTSMLQAQGFSHCWDKEFDGLSALKEEAAITGLGGRKPSAREGNIPQVALYHKQIQTAKKQLQLYQNWCQSVGMPYPTYSVLNMISHHSKGVRPSDISASLILPPQTLTRILAGLQQDEYIVRKVCVNDHRSVVISITDKGMGKIKPLQMALRKMEEKALMGFDTEELAAASELSKQILLALEAAFR